MADNTPASGNSKPTGTGKGCVTLLLLAFIGFYAFHSCGSTTTTTPDSSSSTPSDSSPVSAPAAISISANELASAYNANEVAADDKYKDKVVEVNGTVDSIGKDITDTPYVTLQASGDFLGVQCMFDNQYKGQLAQLQKGQQIRVQGTCKGKTLNVLLADCTLN